MPVSDTTQRKLRMLQRMAWLCALLVLSITTLSAYIRLARAAPTCEPWPQCQVVVTPAPSAEPAASDSGAIALARGLHRIVAAATLVLVLALLVLALRGGAPLRPQAAMAFGLLALVLWLAVLGVRGGASRLPAVVLGNLLGGFALFVLSVRLALARRPAPATGPALSLAPWRGVALALAWLQIALGGLVSAGGAGLSCPALDACDWRSGSWQALNPWHMPGSDAAAALVQGALVHTLHRWCAIALLVAVLALAWRAARQGQRGLGVAFAALALLPVALGLAQVALRLPLPLVLAHNVAAALLLAALTAAGARQAGVAWPR